MNYLGIPQPTQTLTEALTKLLEGAVQIIILSSIVLLVTALGVIIWLCRYELRQLKR